MMKLLRVSDLNWLEKKINETGDTIVAELKSGVNPESVISHSGIEWTTTEKVKRDDMFINRAILRRIFEAGKPNSDKPIITSQRLGSGGLCSYCYIKCIR